MMYLYDEYMMFNRAKGLAEETMSNYAYNLKAFFVWCDDNEINVEKINKADVCRYAMYCQKYTSVHSANTHLSIVRTFLRWMMNEEIIEPFDIELFREKRTIKKIYSEHELELMLKKPAIRKCTFKEYRTWVFENYALATGNRLKSILNIKIGDVDLSSGIVLLKHTKNKEQQMVPLTSNLIYILKEYLRIRGGSEDEYLFCDSYGRGQLCRQTVYDDVAKYNRSRGVENVGIHKFRHTFATMFIKNGGDIYRLSKLLGHKSVVVTENYIQCLPVELTQNYDTINPLEQVLKHINREKIRLK